MGGRWPSTTAARFFLYFWFLSWLDNQSRPSYKPSPLVAHVAWMYQFRFLNECKPSLSVISGAFIAFGKSYFYGKKIVVRSLNKKVYFSQTSPLPPLKLVKIGSCSKASLNFFSLFWATFLNFRQLTSYTHGGSNYPDCIHHVCSRSTDFDESWGKWAEKGSRKFCEAWEQDSSWKFLRFFDPTRELPRVPVKKKISSLSGTIWYQTFLCNFPARRVKSKYFLSSNKNHQN